MRTYSITIGERVLTVGVGRAGDDYLVSLDGGPEKRVALETVHGAMRSLLIDDARSEVIAQRTPEGASVAVGGLEYPAEVVAEARARLASVAGRGGSGQARRDLKAPMPGLLVKVLCEVGDAIEPGQPLAVLQAMKMENELSVARGGTVTAIEAHAGQTVDQGQILLTVE
ncbi:MAG: acetyl-CoA carboxylase biotin carboxyl carrier protein subunit [Chloroflexota bacterium]